MTPGVCRVCGCTENDACLIDVKTGDLVDVACGETLEADTYVDTCSWIEPDLCSGCVAAPAPAPLLYGPDGKPLRGAP